MVVGSKGIHYMKSNEEFLNEQIETLPDLHKDLIYEDEERKSWLPFTINFPTIK